MNATHIALLRGINVGRSKRIAMSELRAVAEALGYSTVRTLLNSGNLAFAAPLGRGPSHHADRLETALSDRLGLRSRVFVLTTAELAAVIATNPFDQQAALHSSRLLVSVFRDPTAETRLAPLVERDWGSERLAVTPAAAYSWHPEGLSAGRLAEAIDRAGKDAVTGRSWSTLLKLQTLAELT